MERNSLVLCIYYFMCNSSGKERRSETRIFSGAFLDVEGGSCYRKMEVVVFYCGKYSSVCASGISALANGFRQSLENLSNCYFVFFLSVLVEVIQYITGTGFSELDDFFNNTLGGWLGCGARFLYQRIFHGRRH